MRRREQPPPVPAGGQVPDHLVRYMPARYEPDRPSSWAKPSPDGFAAWLRERQDARVAGVPLPLLRARERLNLMNLTASLPAALVDVERAHERSLRR